MSLVQIFPTNIAELKQWNCLCRLTCWGNVYKMIDEGINIIVVVALLVDNIGSSVRKLSTPSLHCDSHHRLVGCHGRHLLCWESLRL
jgi:hypothetical protein